MRKLAMLVVLACAPAMGADTTWLYGLGDVSHRYVESVSVGRGYHVYVMLPASYQSDGEATYPTLYLLDGGALFPMITSYYRYLNFGEEVPDLIVVGISYGTDSVEGGNYRGTDYTAPSGEREYWGGAGRFQRFLRDELMPAIESDYRSDRSRRIVFGQSLGGQFVLYSAHTEPGLFWGHIASNPALHRNLPFFLQAPGERADSETTRLFVGSGTQDTPRFREPALRWIAHWTAVDEPPWVLKAVDLDGHTHMSAPPASFRQGMRWLFSE